MNSTHNKKKVLLEMVLLCICLLLLCIFSRINSFSLSVDVVYGQF